MGKMLLDKTYSVYTRESDLSEGDEYTWNSEGDIWHAINDYYGNAESETEPHYSGKVRITVEVIEDKGEKFEPIVHEFSF